MVKTGFYMVRSDGVRLARTYSDTGMMIERDGVRYSEAIDPEELGRTYTETDEPAAEKYEVEMRLSAVEKESRETREAVEILLGDGKAAKK